MKHHNIIAIMGGIFCLFSLASSCTKESDNSEPQNKTTYKTSTGGLINIGDSIHGELGSDTAQVFYYIKGNNQGLKAMCFDQSTNLIDTAFADIAVYIAYTKNDLNNNIFADTIYPSTTDNASKSLGIQDSLYIKITKDNRPTKIDATGKFSFKIVNEILPIQFSEPISLNNSNFTTVDLQTKNGKYYEKWFKVAVIPNSTYYIEYQKSSDNELYTLNYFFCFFYDKDGISSHEGTFESGTTNYISYNVPSHQDTLYIKCYNNTKGTTGMRILNTKP